MRKILAILILAVVFSNSASAQTAGKISGSLKDDQNKPLASATVSLLHAKDSSLAKLAVTDKTGHYEFVNIKEGKYFISATIVGYSKITSDAFTAVAEKAVVIPSLSLTPNAANLAGVTVTSRRPLVETKIDKMVVNVDASPTNAGNSALEVLEKSPGITVDRDGNISLKGKQGVIVLMDGKPTYLSGADLANVLRNMPASQLDQIEIMTQPSAKFDASGTSGVINLRTKKNVQMGMNGSVNLNYVQGRYPKSPNSFNFNYRKGKVNFFSNLSYAYFEGFNELQLNRKFRDQNTGIDTAVFIQQSNGRFEGNNFNARVGMDYSFNKKTTVGVNVNGTYNPRQNRMESVSNLYDENGDLEFTNRALTTNKDPWKNFGANVNLTRTLSKPGHEVAANIDYILYSTNSTQTSNNYTFDAANNPKERPYLLRGVLAQEISIYSAKLDFTKPLEKDAKVEIGAKSSYVKTDNNAPYKSFDHTQNIDTIDGRSDHFVYDENINAAYVSYGRQMKKWGVQGGLRLEHTHSIANSIQLSKKITKDYVQLFPTGFVSYTMDDANRFALSYGRRIERPNYQDLNPFQRILDQYTFQQGNPYLTPQFTHNIELSHNFKGALNTTINYTSTDDIINDILKQNDETKVTFQTKENVAKRRSVGLAVSYNKAVTKIWTTSVFVNVFNNHFEGFVNNRPLTADVTSMMANMSQQFRFNKGWSAEVSGFYRARSQESGLMISEPMGVVSFGAAKQILKNKATIKLNVSDPFWIQRFEGKANFGNINMSIKNQWDNRRVGLSFSYRFSKGQNVQQRKKIGSAQEEQNRVGGGGNQ